MNEGRQQAEWSRTSSLLALLANVHRDPKRQRKAFTPADFDPTATRKKRGAGLVIGKDTLAAIAASIGAKRVPDPCKQPAKP